MLVTAEYLYFLSLIAYQCEIWYLETYCVGNCSHCIEMNKKSYRSSNDDVINLKAMIKMQIRFYFTSTLAWPSETWHLWSYSCC